MNKHDLTAVLGTYMLGFGKEGCIRRPLEVDTLLTLVIALGGIATGIGAIWAALAARRQAQVSERQALVTERSVAQTERSLAEQGQILREQNERARISFEVDLIYKLQERFDSQRFQYLRKKHLTYLKESLFVDDEILEVQHLDAATEQMFDFFEEVGYLARTGVLRLEQVWHLWSGVQSDWLLCEPAVKKLRYERGDPRIYEELEHLHHQMADLERQRSRRSEPPTKEELREFVERNLRYVAALVAEEPDASEEEITKG